jgi:NodT family efflux transporter outer membrane factor (OMF) lipoprotein
VSLPASGGAEAEQSIVVANAVVLRWWELFQSPQVNDTVSLALAASPTLMSARATLAQAEEVVTEARAAYYPQVDLGVNASWSHSRPFGSSTSADTNTTANLFGTGPLLSYSPDLFGHNRRFVEQQAALADDQRYQLSTVYLSLTAGAVSQAVTIASALAQIKAAQDIIATDEHNLELVRIEFDAGIVARTDVLSAESQLASDQTLLPPLQQQLGVARDALSVLVGKLPVQWSPPEFTLETLTLPSELPLTIPSVLIHERPDILAAEALLHAASAAIGVATSELYPNVTLSVSSVLQTATAGSRLDASITSVAAALATPLFHGGALEAQRQAAVDAFDAQLGNYRQTVLQAFGQIADVLQALDHDAVRLRAETLAVATSSESLALAQEAYKAGRGSLLQILDAQRLYGQALLGYAQTKGQRYLDTVLLFEAMGGAAREWLEQAAAGSVFRPGP